jgi:hypothetical protein
LLDVTKLVTKGDCARCASPCMQRWSTCDTSALVPSHPGLSCLESFLRCCAGCETFYPTCSGHGSCIPQSGLCSCTTGYGGNDCSAGILFLMACAITATTTLQICVCTVPHPSSSSCLVLTDLAFLQSVRMTRRHKPTTAVAQKASSAIQPLKQLRCTSLSGAGLRAAMTSWKGELS